MKTQSLQPPRLLLLLGAVCGLGMWVAAERTADARTLPGADGPSMIQAAEAAPVRHRSRRHSTLSMPYFSFARSLRPGS